MEGSISRLGVRLRVEPPVLVVTLVDVVEENILPALAVSDQR